jgi:hypothetical protein
VLKDTDLADAVERIENARDVSAMDSRQAVRGEIAARYTAPE